MSGYRCCTAFSQAVQLLEEKNFEEALCLANSVGDGIEGLGHIVCIKRPGGGIRQSGSCWCVVPGYATGALKGCAAGWERNRQKRADSFE